MHIEEAHAYNSLARETFSDYKAIERLKNTHGSFSAAWSTTYASSKSNPVDAFQKLSQKNVRLLLRENSEFPEILREIPWPPFGIFVRGDISLLENAVAIVGTRKATNAGKEIAKSFAAQLAECGIPVISGLALGIDAAAHAGALVNHKKTIAVLANGLDTVYPRQNESLAENILENNGALISEYPFETPSLPQRFLERNRIISGLSRAIIVIEAPQKSGALATARFALEQNRDVFVVPGDIRHKNYKGSHELIKSGASLITEISDVIHALGLQTEFFKNKAKEIQKSIEGLDEIQKKVITVLQDSGTPLHVEELLSRTACTPQELQKAIAILVVRNHVIDNNGKYLLPL